MQYIYASHCAKKYRIFTFVDKIKPLAVFGLPAGNFMTILLPEFRGSKRVGETQDWWETANDWAKAFDNINMLTNQQGECETVKKKENEASRYSGIMTRKFQMRQTRKAQWQHCRSSRLRRTKPSLFLFWVFFFHLKISRWRIYFYLSTSFSWEGQMEGKWGTHSQ